VTGGVPGWFLGALAGAGLGLGACLVLAGVTGASRARFHTRVMVYLRDLPQVAALPGAALPRSFLAGAAHAFLRGAAATVDRTLGGAGSVQRRLVRSGSAMTVHDFRISQALWGVVAFALVAVPATALSFEAPDRSVPLFVCCCAAAALGVLLRENKLTMDVTGREREMLAEFPAFASLLALAVAAGEGPVAALHRVVARSHGALSAELGRVLGDVRTGRSVTDAFDALASRTGLPVLARFAESIAIAVDRGTPLAEVLHAQAADVREAGRRGLIEASARKEVLMMVPVVLLVLPTVVVFAFFPGLLGLRMVV